MTTPHPLSMPGPAGVKACARALVAGVLLAFATSAAAVEYKLGFVNTERLFREAAPAKRAQAKIEKEFATREG